MKKSVIGLLMLNCGSVTRRTRGLPVGFFLEGAPPPFHNPSVGVLEDIAAVLVVPVYALFLNTDLLDIWLVLQYEGELSIRLDNGTTLAPRLSLMNAAIQSRLTTRCPHPVFQNLGQLHSCAPWAKQCVRDE